LASAAEGASAKQGIAAALTGGVETISALGEVTFTKYCRLVLPLDGYVFWLNSSLVYPACEPQITVRGSFHYSTQQDQSEAENEAVNTVVFTALEPIQQVNGIGENVLWIAEYGGDVEGFDGPITFAFSARGKYYEQADLFHYVGTAVLPAFRLQLIDSADQLPGNGPIVTNSLPIWLALSRYTPPYNNGISNTLPLYPSFIIPDNLPPPYGAVHIFPESTEALESAPLFGPVLDQWSLSRERVRITLYGLDNSAALMFLAAVLQYSYD